MLRAGVYVAVRGGGGSVTVSGRTTTPHDIAGTIVLVLRLEEVVRFVPRHQLRDGFGALVGVVAGVRVGGGVRVHHRPQLFGQEGRFFPVPKRTHRLLKERQKDRQKYTGKKERKKERQIQVRKKERNIPVRNK